MQMRSALTKSVLFGSSVDGDRWRWSVLLKSLGNWAVQVYSLLGYHQQRQSYALHASVHQACTYDRICDVWTLLDISRSYKQDMLVDFYKSLFFFFGKKKKSPMCYIYANKVYSEKIKEDNFSSCFSVLVFCSHRNQFFLIIRNK